jgi:hypothetical protein
MSSPASCQGVITAVIFRREVWGGKMEFARKLR